ncbi:MAG: energy-coupling factor transporter transmembrane protein EcfT [Alphaproteobacteria bacterium]|nr:energy-coupling factor transporter transmembrane protein EcfT [Alphaproteobacteria bacterium]MBU0803914.1 energy-coupling factor transporter transmembrane protein EcfT [Alphaproteobacteria bacterium]MBU0872789.1 energy-coupling factor transporter transmembrane protein EcfT [Alphaproteobacteria bacterium]MBU1402841.1 energy-coupling factor transporter transmembrane protein EcfT [Alphaproteobacteria bacterium]MBU1593483.1 energy-coupling factor transporter transmembrane protein EcfT [Alphaprot
MIGQPGPHAGKSLLYVPGDSFIHRLNPLTKLVGLLWLAATTFMLPPEGMAAIFVAALAFGVIAGAGRAFVRRLLFTLLPFAIALFVIHGLLIERADTIDYGLFSLSADGLGYMGRILVRVAALLTVSMLFVTTTHPAILLKALDSHGVPPGIAYLISSPLLLLEPFSTRARAIRDAQQARGLDLNGSWRARAKAFPALLIPLVTLALSDLDHRASVLDGRAFRARPFRVVLDAPEDRPYERWLRRTLLVALPLQIGLAAWL